MSLESFRKWREKFPLRYAYNNFKQNAKRRKKEFSLTFEQFEQFALTVELVGKRGKTKDSYHIDRIDETKGYSIDNIQLLTCSENVIKSNKIQIRKKKVTNEFGTRYIKEIINQQQDEF